jgi:asparaginyl-tRNA synthetase
MNHIYIKDAKKHAGEGVSLKGWANNTRSSGSIAFLSLRDGTGFIQCVVSKDEIDEKTWKTVETITLESSVEVFGKIQAHPKKPDVFELTITDINIISLNKEEYPISKKEHGPDFLMNHRHLWLRSSRQWAILRIRDEVETAINEYLHQQNFIRVDSPIFTPNACEGTTTLFPVPYFDLGEAYLSQSGQLYIEAAIASVGRCYDFGPVFRAEKSTTKRHLTEFWMMDAEAAFVEHNDNLRLQEGLVKFIIKSCLEKCSAEFEILERNTKPLEKVVEKPFEKLGYKEAVKRLNNIGSDIKFGEDLGNDDEVLLTNKLDVPIFIEKWPKSIKPFYMKQDKEDADLVLNDDLIAIEGAGEIIGGSQREDDFDVLLSNIKRDKLDEKDFEWYLDLRKYGSVPHSGFGIGVERMTRWISGAEHIRECIAFPRLVNRVKP